MSARIVLYSGKGGVGKTSLSAATAIRAAKLGHRTLVVSTDSAHSLADALDRKVGAEPTPILEGLDAVEIDVNQELASHWGTIHEYLTRFMTFRGIDETVAEEIAILPGMEELFSLVRVKAWAESRRWDFIVIDCAPTGDTVRMLAVPEVLSFYFSRIFPLQRTVVRTVRPVAQRMTDMPIPSDDVFGAVKRVYDADGGHGAAPPGPEAQLHPHRPQPRAHGHQRVAAALHLPEPLRLPGGRGDRQPRAAGGGPVEVLRPLVRHPGRPPRRRARADFDPLPFFEAPLFDREMVGTEMLDEFGRRVFGKSDPAAVLHREKPVEVKKEGRAYALYLRLPVRREGPHPGLRAGRRARRPGGQPAPARSCCPARWPAGAVASAGFSDQRLRVAFGSKEAS